MPYRLEATSDTFAPVGTYPTAHAAHAAIRAREADRGYLFWHHLVMDNARIVDADSGAVVWAARPAVERRGISGYES